MSRVDVRILIALCVPVLVCAQPSEAELRRHYEEGERALSAGRYAEAERAYEALRKLSPGTAEVHAKLGLIYFQQAKYEQALPALRQSLKLKPGLPKASVFIAMCLSELGRYREAVPALEQAFHASADPALKRMSGLHLERAYTGLEQHAKAVGVALELSRLYPDDAEILYHTARLFGNYAFLSMRRLSEVAPSSSWRYLSSGEVHESGMNYELALAAYRHVLAVNPSRPGIHLRIGRVLLARHGEDSQSAAAAEFQKEMQLDPTNANAAYELGEILRKSGEGDKARGLFELALKYDPDFLEARVGLARVFLAGNKPEPALDHLRKAHALKPADAVVCFHLARAYQALGNAAEQQRFLEEFRRLRAAEIRRDEIAASPPSSREATKQDLDPKVP